MSRFKRLEVKNEYAMNSAIIDLDDISRIIYVRDREAIFVFKSGGKLQVSQSEAQQIEKELFK